MLLIYLQMAYNENNKNSLKKINMDKPIEITQGSTYIFKGKKANNDTTFRKYKILEVTDTTYLI